jgi:putative (di)nucleoside polyphosphate hydrolase
MTEKPYRLNVGLCITDGHGHLLVGERNSPRYRGTLQMPQGGIDDDEIPQEAAWRELHEETSLSQEDTELLATHPDWLTYDFPPGLEAEIAKHYKGQSQKWFLFKYDGPLPDPNQTIDREFRTFQWETPTILLTKTAPFRQDVYRDILKAFAPLL